MEKQKVISKALLTLGVPAHLLGYKYLTYALNLTLEDRMLVRRMTGGLYPSVAQYFGITASQVERSIRHAIETAWLRGGIDSQIEYFGNSIDPMKGKPTNREFISTVADRLMVEVVA